MIGNALNYDIGLSWQVAGCSETAGSERFRIGGKIWGGGVLLHQENVGCSAWGRENQASIFSNQSKREYT
jgi:hypothetical protein